MAAQDSQQASVQVPATHAHIDYSKPPTYDDKDPIKSETIRRKDGTIFSEDPMEEYPPTKPLKILKECCIVLGHKIIRRKPKPNIDALTAAPYAYHWRKGRIEFNDPAGPIRPRPKAWNRKVEAWCKTHWDKLCKKINPPKPPPGTVVPAPPLHVDGTNRIDPPTYTHGNALPEDQDLEVLEGVEMPEADEAAAANAVSGGPQEGSASEAAPALPRRSSLRERPALPPRSSLRDMPALPRPASLQDLPEFALPQAVSTSPATEAMPDFPAVPEHEPAVPESQTATTVSEEAEGSTVVQTDWHVQPHRRIDSQAPDALHAATSSLHTGTGSSETRRTSSGSRIPQRVDKGKGRAVEEPEGAQAEQMEGEGRHASSLLPPM